MTGLLLGGIAGAATALLLAPESGEDTREQIRSQGIELKNRGEELGSQAMQRGQKMKKEGQKRVSDVQARTGLALEEQKTRLNKAIDAGKQAASPQKDELLNRFEENTAPQVNTTA
jgi:gas vesicle protein